mgnify:CR=1 FL=1
MRGRWRHTPFPPRKGRNGERISKLPQPPSLDSFFKEEINTARRLSKEGTPALKDIPERKKVARKLLRSFLKITHSQSEALRMEELAPLELKPFFRMTAALHRVSSPNRRRALESLVMLIGVSPSFTDSHFHSVIMQGFMPKRK